MSLLMNIAGAAAQEVADKAPEVAQEAAKQVTSENAAGILSSILNGVSNCPSFVTATLDATVGENPYMRGAATLVTLAAVAVPTALLMSNCRKKPAKKPGSTASEPTPELTVTPPAAGSDAAGTGVHESSGSGDEYDDAADDDNGPSAEGEVGENTTRRRRDKKPQ